MLRDDGYYGTVVLDDFIGLLDSRQIASGMTRCLLTALYSRYALSDWRLPQDEAPLIFWHEFRIKRLRLGLDAAWAVYLESESYTLIRSSL